MPARPVVGHVEAACAGQRPRCVVLAHDRRFPPRRSDARTCRMPSRMACSAAASRSAGDDRAARVAADEVVERLRGGARREAELARPAGWCRPPGRARTGRPGPGRIWPTPTLRASRGGRGQAGLRAPARAIRPARRIAWDSASTPGAGDVERARVVLDHRPVQDLQRVVDVHELQPRVAARARSARPAGRSTGSAWCRRVGADERREPQHGGGHVGPAAAEAAHVPLDVEDVAGERRRAAPRAARCPR